jgi:hypothetical protein
LQLKTASQYYIGIEYIGAGQGAYYIGIFYAYIGILYGILYGIL